MLACGRANVPPEQSIQSTLRLPRTLCSPPYRIDLRGATKYFVHVSKRCAFTLFGWFLSQVPSTDPRNGGTKANAKQPRCASGHKRNVSGSDGTTTREIPKSRAFEEISNPLRSPESLERSYETGERTTLCAVNPDIRSMHCRKLAQLMNAVSSPVLLKMSPCLRANNPVRHFRKPHAGP